MTYSIYETYVQLFSKAYIVSKTVDFPGISYSDPKTNPTITLVAKVGSLRYGSPLALVFD